MGTLNGIMLVSSRIFFAMAERKQLPRLFAVTHPRFHTPHFAVLFSAAITLGFSLAGTFISALTVSTIIRLITYATSCMALLVFRSRGGVPPAAFTLPAATFVSFAALGLCAWLLSNSTWNEVRTAGIAAALGLIFWRGAQRDV